jgi:hypothetical protein
MAEHTASAPAAPVVGRSWADTVAETVARIFDLLGKSAIYLIFVGAVVGIYWVFEQRDADRLAALETQRDDLEAQRRAVAEQISGFSKSVMEISQAQVATVGDAFQKLREISQATDEARAAAFASQTAAREAKAEAEAVRAQLATAEASLAARQRDLDAKTAELDAATQALNQRDAEVRRKEEDLTRRAGQIGTLTEDLLTLRELAEEALAAERARVDRLAGALADVSDLLPEADRATVEDILHAGSPSAPSRAAFEQAAGAILDRLADPARLLMPIADFSRPLPPAADLDPLIGVSRSVLAAALAADGFGFDLWLEQGTGSGAPHDRLIGLAFEGARFRQVVLFLRADGVGIARLTEARIAEGLLPLAGRDPEAVWSPVAAFYLFDPSATDRFAADLFAEGGRDFAGTGEVAFATVFSGPVATVFAREGKAAAGFPLLTADALAGLADTPGLPDWQRALIADPALGPRLFLAVQANLAARDAIAAGIESPDPELAGAARRTLAAAIAGDVESLAEILPAIRGEPSGLEQAATIAVRPGARIELGPILRQETPPGPQQVQQQPSPPGWSETAELRLNAPGSGLGQGLIVFARSDRDPVWRIADFGGRKAAF